MLVKAYKVSFRKISIAFKNLNHFLLNIFNISLFYLKELLFFNLIAIVSYHVTFYFSINFVTTKWFIRFYLGSSVAVIPLAAFLLVLYFSLYFFKYFFQLFFFLIVIKNFYKLT